MAARVPFMIWWSIYVEHRLQYFGPPSEPLWAKPVRWFGWKLYLLRRFLQGARPIACRGYEATQGFICEDGIDLTWGGACPVQAEGTVDGRAAYYRSRGEGWSLSIAAPGSDDVFADDAWDYHEAPYFFPDGGWVATEVSERCIRKAIGLFRATTRAGKAG